LREKARKQKGGKVEEDGPKCRSEDEGEKRGTRPRAGRATDENGPKTVRARRDAMWREHWGGAKTRKAVRV
jgi:hypothetical protein